MSDLVLVIDDDATLLGLLAQHLSRAAYHVITAMSGTTGLQMFQEHRPDLVILDVMMPKMNGWAVCERIRETSDVPIIMLTAKGEEQDRLRGFRLGVDDYVVKPFSSAELVARVGAILARYRRAPSEIRCDPIVRGDVIIDLNARRVTRGGQPVHLSPTEFRLLAALAEQPGHPLSPSELLVQVWGSQYADDVENVKRYIHYLRKKLEDDVKQPRLILTERGFGYYLA
ncbi:MAG TPA: response regulator transcription factor [Anaerolineales bacterium]|jgi:two-component system KDP operon response regulator KdpE|nr:response regulator transcription factor [Anaerolineales bacterium]